jgi:hypothetical protein
VVPPDHLPHRCFARSGACNYIAARPLSNGLRRPLYIGQTSDGWERFAHHKKIGPAIIHVHFGARSRQERLDIETALRNLHWTPLNEQPSAAAATGLVGSSFGFGGLAASLGIVPEPRPPVHNAGFGGPGITAGVGIPAGIGGFGAPAPATGNYLSALARVLADQPAPLINATLWPLGPVATCHRSPL